MFLDLSRFLITDQLNGDFKRKYKYVYYFTKQDMVKYCNCAWKKWFFALFFPNISKTAETILIKKI